MKNINLAQRAERKIVFVASVCILLAIAFGYQFDHIGSVQNIIAAIIATVGAIIYNNKKHEHDSQVFRQDLLVEYNQKYNNLAPYLRKLSALEDAIVEKISPSGGLQEIFEIMRQNSDEADEIIDKTFEYLSLCSIEYYWYQKGCIDEDVWLCWNDGMKFHYRFSFTIKKIIEVDRVVGTRYYNADFPEIFS